MTEEEWLECPDPTTMFRNFGAKFSDRKLRLFCCACCRRVWDCARDERLGRALLCLERYTDQPTSNKDRLDASKLARAVREEYWEQTGMEEVVSIAVELWSASAKTMGRRAGFCGRGAVEAVGWAQVSEYDAQTRTERAAQTILLRDIFGNPFRPVAVDPAWLTSDVVALARGIYADRAFDRMPILADALQDAGCNNDDVLNHCRDAAQVHVRECWVVDLLLGKS